MRAALAAVCFATSAGPSPAEVPFLGWPIACTLGKTCYIEDYMDRDPGPQARDWACGIKTRDDHSGTDIALLSLDAMRMGVEVRAAAAGTVQATRDGMPDRPVTPENREELKGRECGNAVRVRHRNGFETLYCHLREGSVRVASGQEVPAGTPLGLVGMSGQTNFPHLHLSVLRDGERVDPFRPEPGAGCARPDDTLWLETPSHLPAHIYTTGFSDAPPSRDAARSGDARRTSLPPASGLALYARLIETATDDLVEFTVTAPDGSIRDHQEVLVAPVRDLVTSVSLAAPDGGWPAGVYTGRVVLRRGDAVIGVRVTEVTVP